MVKEDEELEEKKKNTIKKKKNSSKSKAKKKKSQKKKKKNLAILKWTILILIFLAGIVFIFLSPIFNIKKIEVIGNEKLSEEEIIELSDIELEKNIFIKTKYSIMKKIEKNNYIDEVKIKRKLPSTLKIEVKERNIAYQIEDNENYVYLDSQGYILDITQEKQNIMLLKGVSSQEYENLERLDRKDLEKLDVVIKIKDAFKTINKEEQITYIDIQNADNYIIYLESEKKLIYIGNGSNLNDKILSIDKILQAESGIEGSIYINGNLNENFKPYFSEKVE